MNDRIRREHTEEAIETLVEIMRNPDAPPGVRVAAATGLLDRGSGRPPATVAIAAAGPRRIEDMSNAELLALSEGALPLSADDESNAQIALPAPAKRSRRARPRR